MCDGNYQAVWLLCSRSSGVIVGLASGGRNTRPAKRYKYRGCRCAFCFRDVAGNVSTFPSFRGITVPAEMPPSSGNVGSITRPRRGFVIGIHTACAPLPFPPHRAVCPRGATVAGRLRCSRSGLRRVVLPPGLFLVRP